MQFTCDVNNNHFYRPQAAPANRRDRRRCSTSPSGLVDCVNLLEAARLRAERGEAEKKEFGTV